MPVVSGQSMNITQEMEKEKLEVELIVGEKIICLPLAIWLAVHKVIKKFYLKITKSTILSFTNHLIDKSIIFTYLHLIFR